MNNDNLSSAAPAVDQAINRMMTRIRATAASSDIGFPHIGEEDGSWTRSPAGDWTGGHWVGELWLASECSGDSRDNAITWAKRLGPRADSKTIFRGFLFFYGVALGEILTQKDLGLAELAVAGAEGLYHDAHHQAGVVPLGEEAEEASDVGDAETSIDCVGPVSALMAWAAEETGRKEFHELARSHMAWNLEHLVRADGSVIQSATFDPATGELRRTYTHKGSTPDSTWARAQAWGMLAATMGAKWLPEDRPGLLTYARAVADWWIEHIPATLIPYWDFDVPQDGSESLDTSAAAIAAASLLRLSSLENDEDRAKRYHRFAGDTVEALVSNHLTPTHVNDSRPAGMLVDSCYNHRIGLATSNELIWGDYYLFEALHVMHGSLNVSRI